jgi:hypothetical protein
MPVNVQKKIKIGEGSFLNGTCYVKKQAFIYKDLKTIRNRNPTLLHANNSVWTRSFVGKTPRYKKNPRNFS